jgi:hypothetical protein
VASSSGTTVVDSDCQLKLFGELFGVVARVRARAPTSDSNSVIFISTSKKYEVEKKSST